ncbi:MAG TPA: sigma-70 family RNA polymerase sigma factor [Caulobacteraceae bacterium]|nr:sigma-70 family RNA polymerase sigma factor [Caulobacteraceae bacterium]
MTLGSDQNNDRSEGVGEPTDLSRAFLVKRDDLVRYFSVRLRSREAAEDLIQDLFVRICALEPAAPIENPTAYLFRLAHNQMLDRLRSAQRSGARDEAWRRLHSTQVAGHEVMDEPSPEHAAAASQRLRRTMLAIQSLPPKTRRAFELHRLEGLSQEQTAQALGVSRKTVEKQVSAALKHLLAKLSKAER